MKKISKLKFYIPVISGNHNSGITLLNANKIQLIKDLYPTWDVIRQHLQVEQQRRKEEDYKFRSIKVNVKKGKYHLLLREIRKKFGKDFINTQSIDLCVDSNTIPLIQIIEE